MKDEIRKRNEKQLRRAWKKHLREQVKKNAGQQKQ